MLTLPYASHVVQIVGLPERIEHVDAIESALAFDVPYVHERDEALSRDPSPEDEAYDTGYRLARDGEDPRMPWSPGRTEAMALRFTLGVRHGKRARQLAGARELGRTLAASMDRIEAPAGLDEAEAEAFAAGVREGIEEAREDAKFEAWVDYEETLRLEDHFDGLNQVRDEDVMIGCER